jgi:hypothetical protein
MRRISTLVARIRVNWSRIAGVALCAFPLLPVQAFAFPINQCGEQYARYVQIYNEVKGTSEEPKFMFLYEKDRVDDFIESIGANDDLTFLRGTYKHSIDNHDAYVTTNPNRLMAAHNVLKECLFEKRIAELTGGGGAVPPGGGMQGADSATGGAVGQNRGKGGNPDWLYDDNDHGKCVSVEGVAPTGGTAMAYGRHKMINACAYPIKLLVCISVDRADGTPAPNFEKHQEGARCPGMGWGGTTLNANETKDGREWFEYRNLKWDILACREGWDFVGADGRFPSGTIGEKYSCRQRRQNN